MIATRDQYRAFRRFGKFKITEPLVLNVDGAVKPCRYRTGKTYAIQQQAQRKARLRGRALAERDETEWTITFTLAADETVRLLAADSTRGYTDQSHRAMTGEPEAIPVECQQELTDHTRALNAERKRQRLAEMRDGFDAASCGFGSTMMTRRERRHLEEIEHHLAQLEGLNREAA